VSKIIKTTEETHAAIFEDIEQIAEEERSRIFGAPPEPEDIKLLREETQKECRRLILEAKEQAKAIRAQAKEEGYNQGKEEGYRKGFEDGIAQMTEERERYRSQLESFVALIEEERVRLWNEAEPQILQFALEIAQKIVKDEARINHEVAISVIKNAMRRIVDTNNIRIRVNGSDLEAVRGAREDIAQLVDGIRHLEIVEDRRVSPGGCVVETSGGNIDSRIETQFAEVEKLFTSGSAHSTAS
jgi:flagellar assembly protein FliH